MNYQNLIQRVIDGLDIISNHVPASTKVVAQGYIISIPKTDYDDYSKSEIESLKDMGWSWDKVYGWIITVIG